MSLAVGSDKSRGRPGRLKDRERYGTGDKDENKNWEVSTGKTGLPFQEFRLFRKISSGTNQNVLFHLHPKQNFGNFLVNGNARLLSELSFSDRWSRGAKTPVTRLDPTLAKKMYARD